MLKVYTWSSLDITRTQARAWHLLGTWQCWLNGCHTFAWDIVKYAITSSFDWGQNPLFISKILYQVMAWRPFGARPLSDIICIIIKFSDKTCLVTEILSVTSNEGLKLLIQLLYIITNIIKKLWALVRLSFTQICLIHKITHSGMGFCNFSLKYFNLHWKFWNLIWKDPMTDLVLELYYTDTINSLHSYSSICQSCMDIRNARFLAAGWFYGCTVGPSNAWLACSVLYDMMGE